jgi:hypothetical protein
VRLKLMHQIFKDSSPMFVIFELIEAGARWGQEHHIAGTRGV